MAIERTYGKVSDYGELGKAAGQAEAEIRKEGDALRIQQQMLQINADERLTTKKISHDIEMREFEEQVSFEQAKQGHVWDLESTAQRNQFNLQTMLEQQKIKSDMMFSKKLNDEMLQESERTRKLTALDKALENNQLSEAEANRLRLKINAGSFPQQQRAGSGIDQLLADVMNGTGQAPSPQATSPQAPSGTRVIGADDIPDAQSRSDNFPEHLEQFRSNPLTGYPSNQESKSNEPFIKKGIWGFRKKVPNMPVIKQGLMEAIKSGDLTDEEKKTIAVALQSGDEKLIVEMFKRI